MLIKRGLVSLVTLTVLLLMGEVTFAKPTSPGYLNACGFPYPPCPQPTVEFKTTSSSGDESLADPDTMTIKVSPTHSSTIDVKISIGSCGGSPVKEKDYTTDPTSFPYDNNIPPGYILTIPSHTSVLNVPLSIIDDLEMELPDEGLSLRILSVSTPNGNVKTGSNLEYCYTIIDNDFVHFSTSTSSGDEEGVPGPQSVIASIDAPFSENITIDYKYDSALSTASISGDFTLVNALPQTIIFAGDTSAVIPFNVLSDTEVESSEDIVFNLLSASSPSHPVVPIDPSTSLTTHTYTILDNDTAVVPPTNGLTTVNFSQTASNSSESAGNISVKVVLDKADSKDLVVTYLVQDKEAVYGSDYVITGFNALKSSYIVSIPAGSTEAFIPITVLDDSQEESSENFTITLSQVTGGAQLGTSTYTHTILDNDAITTVPTFECSSNPEDTYTNKDGEDVIVAIQPTGMPTEITCRLIPPTKEDGTPDTKFSTTIQSLEIIQTEGTRPLQIKDADPQERPKELTGPLSLAKFTSLSAGGIPSEVTFYAPLDPYHPRADFESYAFQIKVDSPALTALTFSGTDLSSEQEIEAHFNVSLKATGGGMGCSLMRSKK